MTFVTGPDQSPGLPRRTPRGTLRGYPSVGHWRRRAGFQGLGGWTLGTTTWPKLGAGTANVGDTVTLSSPWGDKVTGVLQNLQLNPTTVVAAIPYVNPAGNYANTDPFAGKGYYLTLWGDVVDLATGRAFSGNNVAAGANTGPYVPPAPDMAVSTPTGAVPAASTLPTGGVTNIGGTAVTVDTTPQQFQTLQQTFQATTAAPPPATTSAPAAPPTSAPPAPTSATSSMPPVITVAAPPDVFPAPPSIDTGLPALPVNIPDIPVTVAPVTTPAPPLSIPAASATTGAGFLDTVTTFVKAHPVGTGMGAVLLLAVLAGRRGGR